MTRNLTLGIFGAFVLAALASACGSSVVDSGGGGTPDCGDFAACEPACPSPLPVGGNCPMLGQICGTLDECGYGQQAVCTTSGWQLDSYDPGPDECGCGGVCPQPTCPAAQPAQGAPCTGEGLACEYGNPSCYDAGATATCTGGTWNVSEYGPACLGLCPATLPTAGMGCDGCCSASGCTYFDESGCPALLSCYGGAWQISPSDCVPTSPCSPKGADECLNAQGCRWIAQAQCPSMPATFTQGCHPDAPCATDADCAAGTTCKAVEVDPCPFADCNACSMTAYLCLP